MSPRTLRFASIYTTLAAVVVALCSPLLAVAYFATPDGASELANATVAAWADPARHVLGALETFAAPQTVYLTYGRILTLAAPALLVAALAVRTTRPNEISRLERAAWPVTLVGYALAVIGIMGAFWTPFLDTIFLIAMVPGMLLTPLASTALGVALLRSQRQPRATGWLLALCIPLMVLGSVVLGHNSLGMVPLFVAWALAVDPNANETSTASRGHDLRPAITDPSMLHDA
jgi:hypothetical protein